MAATSTIDTFMPGAFSVDTSRSTPAMGTMKIDSCFLAPGKSTSVAKEGIGNTKESNAYRKRKMKAVKVYSDTDFPLIGTSKQTSRPNSFEGSGKSSLGYHRDVMHTLGSFEILQLDD